MYSERKAQWMVLILPVYYMKIAHVSFDFMNEMHENTFL